MNAGNKAAALITKGIAECLHLTGMFGLYLGINLSFRKDSVFTALFVSFSAPRVVEKLILVLCATD